MTSLTSTLNTRATSWPLTLAWLATNVAGFAFVGALFHFPGDFRTGSSLTGFSPEALLFGVLLGGITGLVPGLLQWLVLRRRLPGARGWIFATALGIAVTHGLNDALPYGVPMALLVLAGGVLLGLLQWLALRGRVPLAWVAATTAIWLVAWWAGFAAVEAAGLFAIPWRSGLDVQTHGLFGVIFGLVYGVLAGAALLGLLQRDRESVLSSKP